MNAIVFPTEGTRYDFRAIKCLAMDEMETLRFRLTPFGENNIGILIGSQGSNLARLSKLASPPDSTYFPRIKLTKKDARIIEITYKKNSHIDKDILIENIIGTWAKVNPGYSRVVLNLL